MHFTTRLWPHHGPQGMPPHLEPGPPLRPRPSHGNDPAIAKTQSWQQPLMLPRPDHGNNPVMATAPHACYPTWSLARHCAHVPAMATTQSWQQPPFLAPYACHPTWSLARHCARVSPSTLHSRSTLCTASSLSLRGRQAVV